MASGPRRRAHAASLTFILCAVILMAQTFTSAAGSSRPKQVPPGAGAPPSVSDQADSVSRLQILHPPGDLVTDGDCESRVTVLTLRATRTGVRGLLIVGGTLSDSESKYMLPDTAFELVQQRPDVQGCEKQFAPLAAGTAIPNTDLMKIYIRLRKEWVRPGSYGGDLLLIAPGDTGVQTIPLKVFIRPRWSWWCGFLAILLGTLLSTSATVWLVRRQQLAANELFIARLDGLLEQLRIRLEEMERSGAPRANLTLAHIDEIRRKRLPQLTSDKELAVLAGVTVPATGEVTVLEDVEGVTRVVRNGFEELFSLWQGHPAQQRALAPHFEEMDRKGGTVDKKSALETAVTEIINAAKAAVASGSGVASYTAYSLPLLREETTLVHRLIRVTNLLEVLSIGVLVAVGMYVVVWKNPGFGNAGDLLAAFGWGLGLKFGADAARLTPGDIRRAVGVRIPTT